ncbi:EF-P 5-aminopentanol modification-associated protein YfmH [Brevibacillus daliensis]|uniref:EF-P 5-aminopentanol modification-associated protein YfmH n=1 Tax=Brevibacillus daliensis TaxID=2892995 RepID=UPI001E618D0D|nr:pitrilysin family protein [Brevibacillus daliensis]
MKTVTFDQVNETLYYETLPNGLSVFLLPKEGFSKTYAVFTTRYGSNDSHFKLNGKEIRVPDGIAHFLEHKLFEKEQGDVAAEFSRNGASYNAFTTFNRTAYLFSSTDKVEENLKILLDFVQEPYFSGPSVEREKGIIGQEIQMYDDNPDWKVYTNLLQAMYQEYPVRLQIAGTIESISNIDKDLLYSCYETFYHPSNMILFVVGGFDQESITRLIKDNQAAKDFSQAPEIERVFPDEIAQVSKKQIEATLSVGIPKLYIGFKEAVNGLTGEALLKRELSTKLGLDVLFGTSSPFYQKHYDSGLVTEGFGFDYSNEHDYGYSIIGGDAPDPERLVEEVKQVLKMASEEGLDEEAFQRQKRKSIGLYMRSLNSIEFIANQFTSYKFNDIDLFDVVPTLEKITLEEVTERMKEHLREVQMAVSIVRSP